MIPCALAVLWQPFSVSYIRMVLLDKHISKFLFHKVLCVWIVPVYVVSFGWARMCDVHVCIYNVGQLCWDNGAFERMKEKVVTGTDYTMCVGFSQL